jgi:hypothetical protein
MAVAEKAAWALFNRCFDFLFKGRTAASLRRSRSGVIRQQRLLSFRRHEKSPPPLLPNPALDGQPPATPIFHNRSPAPGTDRSDSHSQSSRMPTNSQRNCAIRPTLRAWPIGLLGDILAADVRSRRMRTG